MTDPYPNTSKFCARSAGGKIWTDASLEEWNAKDFRMFCGDLGPEVSEDLLAKAFTGYSSIDKVKIVRDSKTGKSKGYGFISFSDGKQFLRALKEMNGKFVGSRPIKLKKSLWKERQINPQIP